MIRRELAAPDAADTIIFLGPTSRYLDKIPKTMLPERGESQTRLFYVRYEAPELVRTGTRQSPPTRRSTLIDHQDAPDDSRIILDPSQGQTDIIARAVTQLNGKTLIVYSPASLAEAIRKIEDAR
jgi:hypothetical protein